MEKVSLTDKKVENMKNSPVYSQIEMEINLMFERIIKSIVSENEKLKKENVKLKRVVYNTMKEKGLA